MTIDHPLAGVYAAAVTPVKLDTSLDLEAVPTLLRFLALRGCHGVVLFGTTGEGPSFSPSERELLMRAAYEARKSMPDFRLIAGTGTDNGLFAWFSEVIKKAVPSNGYLLGYHFPSVVGIGFSMELLTRLKDA